jgi:hypothetical protein
MSKFAARRERSFSKVDPGSLLHFLLKSAMRRGLLQASAQSDPKPASV